MALKNLQLSAIEEGLKSFRREVVEKPLREVGRELGLGLTSPINLYYPHIFLDYIIHNKVCIIIHRHVQIIRILHIMDGLNVHYITPF